MRLIIAGLILAAVAHAQCDFSTYGDNGARECDVEGGPGTGRVSETFTGPCLLSADLTVPSDFGQNWDVYIVDFADTIPFAQNISGFNSIESETKVDFNGDYTTTEPYVAIDSGLEVYIGVVNRAPSASNVSTVVVREAYCICDGPLCGNEYGTFVSTGRHFAALILLILLIAAELVVNYFESKEPPSPSMQLRLAQTAANIVTVVTAAIGLMAATSVALDIPEGTGALTQSVYSGSLTVQFLLGGLLMLLVAGLRFALPPRGGGNDITPGWKAGYGAFAVGIVVVAISLIITGLGLFGKAGGDFLDLCGGDDTCAGNTILSNAGTAGAMFVIAGLAGLAAGALGFKVIQLEFVYVPTFFLKDHHGVASPDPRELKLKQSTYTELPVKTGINPKPKSEGDDVKQDDSGPSANWEDGSKPAENPEAPAAPAAPEAPAEPAAPAES